MQFLPQMPPSRALIGGDWVVTQATLDVESPSNGRLISRIARCQASEVDGAVRAVADAFSGRVAHVLRRDHRG
jgi:aldehyde dehydrogenase (NAD+)